MRQPLTSLADLDAEFANKVALLEAQRSKLLRKKDPERYADQIVEIQAEIDLIHSEYEEAMERISSQITENRDSINTLLEKEGVDMSILERHLVIRDFEEKCDKRKDLLTSHLLDLLIQRDKEIELCINKKGKRIIFDRYRGRISKMEREIAEAEIEYERKKTALLAEL
jgi:hypothetical protein